MEFERMNKDVTRHRKMLRDRDFPREAAAAGMVTGMAGERNDAATPGIRAMRWPCERVEVIASAHLHGTEISWYSILLPQYQYTYS